MDKKTNKSAFRLENALKAIFLKQSPHLTNMNAWNSVGPQKNAAGPHTSQNFIFASCYTTAQAWMLRNVQTV
jgi:hypothetical protein